MTITLKPEQERIIQRKIQSGHFRSSGEMLDHALAGTESLYVSVLTLGEIRFGVELLPPSKRRAELEQWLDQAMPEWFGDRILSVDRSIADRWGPLRAEA